MDKASLRDELRARRDGIDVQGNGERLAEAYVAANIDASVVAAYWPIRSEIDTRPLMEQLREQGAQLVLPRVEKRGDHMAFHLFDGEVPSTKDVMNIPAPDRYAEILRPDLVLVPLLGFDRSGYRLGYGGGYYDRALAKLRATGPVTAVGLAYAAQEVEEIPREPHDQPLDWVVTEEGVRVAPNK